MIPFNQFPPIQLKQSPVQLRKPLTMHFRNEIQSVCCPMRLENPRNHRNVIRTFPDLAASDPDWTEFLNLDNLDFLASAPPVFGEALQELTTEKAQRFFLIIMDPGKVVQANGVEVIEVFGIPTDPTEKQAHCRGLAYKLGIHDAGNRVVKLCTTGGGGGGSLLDLQSLDLTGTYLGGVAVIEQLLFKAREKSLNDFIGQVQADCAEKEGKEAAAQLLEMVNKCPREVLANLYSVEIWHMLVDLEDKVKEDFMKLPLCKRPEIIDPPPAACSIYPIPGPDWKASSSSTTAADHGGGKVFCVPDLNEPYVEEEAGKSTVDFAFDWEEEEEKADSKKRKAEAASGEGQTHVPKMPSFPAAFP